MEENCCFQNLSSGECLEIRLGPQSRILKAGVVANSSFAGNPLVASVAFTTPFPAGASVVVQLSGQDARVWSYTLTVISGAVTGFAINSNAETALTGSVSWVATTAGETS